MRIKVGNISSQIIVGGKDNLLPIDVFKELDAYMAVPIKGSHFNKASFKGWDGKRHFLTATGRFGTGFLPMVVQWCEENGVDIDHLEDERRELVQLKPEEELDWTAKGGEWQVDEKQRDAVMKADNWLEYGGGRELYFPRGIYDIATNGGKTTIMLSLIKNLKDAKVLVLVSSLDLLLQTVKLFEHDFENVGRIHGKAKGVKESFTIGDKVTVAMYKTLYLRSKKSVNVEKMLKKDFNVLFVDECHEASGNEYARLIQKIDAGARYFFSGTALKSADKVKALTVVGLSGGILKKITKKELMDSGRSLPVKVIMHHNKTSPFGSFGYEGQLRQCLYFSGIRADMIGDIIDLAVGKKVLINFKEYEHGYFMYDHIKEVYGFEDMDIVHGTDPDRSEKIRKFTTGEITILFASNILKQGISIEDIDTLIYAQGGKAEIFLSQWSGRIERHDGVSENVEIHDFYDEGAILSKHSMERIKFYKKEQFEITTTYEHKKYKPTGI